MLWVWPAPQGGDIIIDADSDILEAGVDINIRAANDIGLSAGQDSTGTATKMVETLILRLLPALDLHLLVVMLLLTPMETVILQSMVQLFPRALVHLEVSMVTMTDGTTRSTGRPCV